MSRVTLRYDGIAVGSNESFSVESVSEKEYFSQTSDVVKRSSAFGNLGNPHDLYSVSLDGSVLPIPEHPFESEKVGIWSVQQSGSNGVFAKPISISIVAEELFTTAGITLRFDTQKGIFANRLLIKWYRENTLVSEKEFFPDKADFFCANRVELYNRVDITFYGINAPQCRLWLQQVSFGIVTDFTEKNLKSSVIKQEISPLSEALPISTLNFSIYSKEGIDFVFQQRQPIDAFFEGSLKGRFFIKTATQKGEGFYTVSCEDYIGHLESATFNGGVYDRTNAGFLTREICDKAGVPVVFPADIENAYEVSGFIPRGSCRKALQQVLFALQLVADASNAESLVLRRLDDKIKQNVPRNRIMQGISVKDSERMTEFSITAHTYTVDTSVESVVLYDAKESGAGNNIEIAFSEPHHSLILTNGHFVERSANYVVINATESTVLRGKPYVHSTVVRSKKNNLLTNDDKKNVLEVKEATLINQRNVDFVLNKCYDYFVKNKTISAKIVEGKHEGENGYVYDQAVSLGDKLSLSSPFTTDLVGVLEKQSYSMNGGILVKECSLR